MQVLCPAQQGYPQQWADDGADRIHCPVETGGPFTRFGMDGLDHDGIAQRATQPLPNQDNSRPASRSGQPAANAIRAWPTGVNA